MGITDERCGTYESDHGDCDDKVAQRRPTKPDCGPREESRDLGDVVQNGELEGRVLSLVLSRKMLKQHTLMPEYIAHIP
jgi:hypothetical protein